MEKIRKVALTCNKDNPKAIKLYESMGFSANGVAYDDEIELVLMIE